MTQEHPITPPPEVVQEWIDAFWNDPGYDRALATRATQWGSDQELEALLVWLRVKGFDNLASDLLSARRPKPPSLKEQALEALAHILNNSSTQLGADTIRRALEQLPDHE
jgi:hypothetical protein